jgi:hypothetical protein
MPHMLWGNTSEYDDVSSGCFFRQRETSISHRVLCGYTFRSLMTISKGLVYWLRFWCDTTGEVELIHQNSPSCFFNTWTVLVCCPGRQISQQHHEYTSLYSECVPIYINCLFNDVANSTLMGWLNEFINWKGCGGKWLWTIGVFQDHLEFAWRDWRKPWKHWDNPCPDNRFKPGEKYIMRSFITYAYIIKIVKSRMMRWVGSLACMRGEGERM